MNPINHKSANLLLTKPDELTDEQCISITGEKVIFDDGTYGINTYWKPTPTELIALNSNHCVKLTILGVSHPPVAVNVCSLTNHDIVEPNT